MLTNDKLKNPLDTISLKNKLPSYQHKLVPIKENKTSKGIKIPDTLEEVRKLGRSYRRIKRISIQRKYASLQAVCIYVDRLEKGKNAWQKFCNDPFWKGATRPPKVDKPGEALRYTVKIFMNSKDNKADSLDYRALKVLRADGVPSNEIADAIKARGGPKKITTNFKDGFINSKKEFNKVISDNESYVKGKNKEESSSGDNSFGVPSVYFKKNGKCLGKIRKMQSSAILNLKVKVLANGDLRALNAKILN